MAKDIATRRMSSGSCDASTPSQLAESPITKETPEYLFQHVCSHFFIVCGHGPKYTAEETKPFLSKLLVYHSMSSVCFQHVNQKAERSVGTAKRIIRESVKPSGELDTVTLIKGLLQPRNTPDQDNGTA